MPICPFIGLSVYRRRPVPICPFIGLSVYRRRPVPICQFIGLSVYRRRPVPICPFIGLSVYRRWPEKTGRATTLWFFNTSAPVRQHWLLCIFWNVSGLLNLRTWCYTGGLVSSILDLNLWGHLNITNQNMAFRVRRGRGLDLKDVLPRSQQAWRRQQQILPGHPS